MKIDKKKIACFALASALAIPCAVGLTGCTDKHTHSFGSEIYYKVQDNKAYTHHKCSCGAKDKMIELEGDYIIASADATAENYAQKVLDGNVSGKTIVLDDGTYGELSIRPARNSETKVYADDNTNGTVNEEITDLSTLANDKNYEYVRTINGLKIVGTENARLTDKIITMSDMSNNNGLNYSAIKYDAVRDLDYTTITTTTKHYAHFKITNLSFENLNFVSPQGMICFVETALSLDDGYLDGVTIKNCTFKTDVEEVKYSLNTAVLFYTESSENIYAKNIVIENNVIDGCYAGFNLQNFENASIKNNVIKNTEHNAIGLYKSAYDEAYFTGNILIENNVIEGTLGAQKDPVEGEFGERAIRLNGGKNASITIKNNKIKDAVQYYSDTTKKSEILKASSLTNCSFDFENNSYDGVVLEAVNKTTGTHASIIINPAE